MAEKYAFIVPATIEYQRPLTALINSINKYHNDVDIIVLDGGVDKKSLPKNVLYLPLTMTDKIEKARAAKIERYKVLTDMKGVYDSCCLLDADMFIVRNVEKYFKIADKAEFIVGTSDCSNIIYGKEYIDKYPESISSKFYNTKTITAVPLFINPNVHHEVAKKAFESCRINRSINDTTALNMAICHFRNFWESMIVLPAHAWTGIHHSMLKPETRIMERVKGHYTSRAGDEVYMIHGRWWNAHWIKDLRDTMERYFKGELVSEERQLNRFLKWVDESIAICRNIFEGLFL